MSKFIPLQKDKHAGKKWKAPTNFAFAAKDSMVPIVGIEAAIAAVNMPLAFVRQEKSMQLAAIMAPPRSADNFFIGRDGRWLGTYIPAVLRAYPFRLALLEGRNELALCIDSDAISEEGQPLYDDAGQDVAAPVKSNMKMLEMYEKSRLHTERASSALQDAGVLAEWPLKFKNAKGEEVTTSGLMRVDEKALNELNDDVFLKLRKAGALAIAYAQVISMSRLSSLGQLAQLRDKLAGVARSAQQQGKDAKLDFLRVEDGNIVF